MFRMLWIAVIAVALELHARDTILISRVARDTIPMSQEARDTIPVSQEARDTSQETAQKPAQPAAQDTILIFQEAFDSVAPPALPAGWRSSQRKTPGTNDWGTTSSTVFSPPGAVLTTNATLEQWLVTPVIDCRGQKPDGVRMAVRRSGTFIAQVAVEMSLDAGVTFPFSLGIIGRDAGSGVYQAAACMIPDAATGESAVVLRWRVLPESTGTSGTFRMDDIQVTARFAGGTRPDSVIFNEIMYTPRSGEPEWVELMNTGHEQTDIQGWSLSDASITLRHTIAGASVLLDPGELVVLTPDTAALAGSRRRITSRILQTDGFPSLNNGGDFLHLYARTGHCADSVGYLPAWGGGPGVSLERIDGEGPSNAAGNWVSSVDSAGATPGRTNSMARRTSDLSAVQMSFPGRCSGDICDVSIMISNTGRAAAPDWSILLYDDMNRDSVAGDAEVIDRIPSNATIAPGDALVCDYVWVAPVPGKHSLRAQVFMDGDERESNNSVSAAVIIPTLPGSVRINEIMYEPLAGMPEFVELINSSTVAVELDDCVLSDRPTEGGSINQWKPGGRSIRVSPGTCAVIVADSTGPAWFPSLRQADAATVLCMNATGLGLNNDGDVLVLKSAGGVVLDSLEFSPSFHSPDIPDTRGRSLELINPALSGAVRTNWGTCVDPSGGTPGVGNSIAVEVLPPVAALQVAPNPFSPDGDGVDDVAVLSYSLPVRSSLIRVRLFDVRGRSLRELANITPAGAEGRLVWDGRDDRGVRVRIGAYVAILEAIDGAGGVTFAAKCVVILAGRL